MFETLSFNIGTMIFSIPVWAIFLTVVVCVFIRIFTDGIECPEYEDLF